MWDECISKLKMILMCVLLFIARTRVTVRSRQFVPSWERTTVSIRNHSISASHRQAPGLVRISAWSLLALTAGTGVVVAPISTPPAHALEGSTCSPSQRASAEVVRDGHFDVGAVLAESGLTVVIKDDRTSPAQWKPSPDLIFALDDAAKTTVPDGMGEIAPAGSEVYLIGATQQPGVPWLGWNTQDQGLVEQVDGPVSMSLDSLDGPGTMSVFLSGNFGNAPTPVFGSNGPRSFEVPLHTHQHGNWVFTKPGLYTATITYRAHLKNGQDVTSTAALRFAVGADAVAASSENPGGAAACGQGQGSGPGGAVSGGTQHHPTGEQAPGGGTGIDDAGTARSDGGAIGQAAGETAGQPVAGDSDAELAYTGPEEDAMIVKVLYGATLISCGGLLMWAIRGRRKSA